MEEKSLEGWAPGLDDGLTLTQVIDRAFDYRGNVTVVKTDGTQLIGYLFNRDSRAKTPFVQLFDERGDGPFTLLYSEIRTIKFTGKDTAAGRSWEAWVKRKEQEKRAAGGES